MEDREGAVRGQCARIAGSDQGDGRTRGHGGLRYGRQEQEILGRVCAALRHRGIRTQRHKETDSIRHSACGGLVLFFSGKQ